MNKPCKSLKDIIKALDEGESPETAIPLSFSGDIDCYIEILALYIKFGDNPERLKVCEKKLEELYETR